MKNLNRIEVTKKTGDEKLTLNGRQTKFSLVNYWSWAYSDILSNTLRGDFAEYLVACDLGLSEEVTELWTEYDLKMKEGYKIEVKSSSYLQSWKQHKLSLVSFDIAKRRAWDPDTSKMGEISKRHSDIYVFCLLEHKDKSTVNPLNLNQWKFYVLKTSTLDQKVLNQKKITLKSLEKLNPEIVEFGCMKKTIINLMA